MSRYGGAAKRLWMRSGRTAAEQAMEPAQSPISDPVVLRVAYFYVDVPVADLDNIAKPIQDVLTKLIYQDDIQVVDLVASMRRKTAMHRVRMSATLARGFAAHSDFVYVVVDHASSIEVFHDRF